MLEMNATFEKDKAYMETLKTFRILIEIDYKDGGWLPPSRQMCEKLNVSSVTYVKATNRLIEENIAESFPRKGIYILPKKFRHRKIGVVIGSGQESPFLLGKGIFAATLDHIEDAGYSPQLIQGSPISNIPRNALSHYVEGLIWLLPTPQAFPVIQDIHQNNLFPLITVQQQTSTLFNGSINSDVPSVYENGQAVLSKFVDILKERKHKKILYIGDLWFTNLDNLASQLKEIGIPFNNDDIITYSMLQSQVPLERLQSEEITGVISEGSDRWHELLFQQLSDLPDQKQPEVIVRSRPLLPDLINDFPKVKIAGISDGCMKKWGIKCVEIMLNHLNNGEKLHSAQVETFHIKSD